MGRESVARFWKKVESDAKLQKAIEGLFKPRGKRTVATATSIVDLASSHGFKFTAEELKKHLAATGGGSELSEGELEAVAGGSYELNVDDKSLNIRPGSRIALF